MLTYSLMGLGRAWQLCGHELQKNTSQKKLEYSFRGIWTPDLCCSFMTDKTPSYTNLNPGRRLVVYKGETTELLDWRRPSGLVEYNQPIQPRLHIYLQSNNITQIQVNFDPYIKTQSLLTPVHKPNQFLSLNWNQVKFDPPHWAWVLPRAGARTVMILT